MTHGFQKEESTSVDCGNGEFSWTSMLKQWVGIKRQQEQRVCGLNLYCDPSRFARGALIGGFMNPVESCCGGKVVAMAYLHNEVV